MIWLDPSPQKVKELAKYEDKSTFLETLYTLLKLFGFTHIHQFP